MFHDVTFTDVSRVDAHHEDTADFLMDEDNFRSFYDRNARGLWTYLARVTGDRQLADDLLQETFYRFLRASAAYENEDHRRHSIYRIATNLARDARRRSLTHPFAPVGDDIERVAAAVPVGSPDRAAMLWLAYAEGATHSEIARTLGLSPASMKILLFRARRKLAGLLGGNR
jgi:RNA polymerase sigma-70 factor (ECF subfamily)